MAQPKHFATRKRVAAQPSPSFLGLIWADILGILSKLRSYRTTKIQRRVAFAAIAFGIICARDSYFLTKLAAPLVNEVKEVRKDMILSDFTPKGATPHTHARNVIIETYVARTSFDTTDSVQYQRLKKSLTMAFDSVVLAYEHNEHVSQLAAYELACKQLKVDLGEGFSVYPWKTPKSIPEPVITGINRKKGSKLSDKGINDWGNISDEISVKEYIEKYHKIAISEMEKFGIPASVALAQGLVESSAGNSYLARNNNNHFGMKCFSKRCHKGHCTNRKDDHHKDFFRKYKSAWESWRAHSQLLAGGHYSRLKKYGRDYQQWAYGLKALGYATDRTYAEKLIGMIEKYDLDKYDK